MLTLALLNAVDFLTTKILIERHGIDIELNPLLHSAMSYFGTTWAIAWVKIVIIGTAWLLIYMLYQPGKHPRVVPAIIMVMFAYLAVTIWNYIQVLT